MNNKNLPDFLCAGAAKSGTTSLFQYLEQHPKIEVPKKETFFLAYYNHPKKDKIFSQKMIQSLSDYHTLYPRDIDKDILYGDFSNTNLYDYSNAIDNIKQLYGEEYNKLKIIIILRNPIERAFSHYTMLVKNGYEKLSFTEAIKNSNNQERLNIRHDFNYIAYGMYYKQVKAYKDSFESVSVYLYEDLKEPQKLVKDILKFLSLDTNMDINTSFKANQSGKVKFTPIVKLIENKKFRSIIKFFIPNKFKIQLKKFKNKVLSKLLIKEVMDANIKKNLIDVYHDDIKLLEKLIDRDLSHWVKR